MAELFKSGADGAGKFAADVDTAGFVFCCRGHNVFYSLVEDIKGSIYAITVGTTKVILNGRTTAGLWVEKIGVVGGDFLNHITIIISDGGIWICV